MKLLGDFLRDLALNREDIFQIAVVLLGPHVRVRARIDQLRIDMEPGSSLAYAALQHMRHTERMANLMCVPVAAILHYTRSADDFEIGNLRQLGQKVVLNTIGKRGIFS